MGRCPYESGDIAGQIKMETEHQEWIRKNRTQYDTMITHLKETRGLIRELEKPITHKEPDFVLTSDLKKGCSGNIITVTIPGEYELGIYKGYSDIEYPDFHMVEKDLAYGFKIKAADASGREVDGSTKVEILVFEPFSKMFRRIEYTVYEKVCGKHGFFKFEKHGQLERLKQQQIWRLENPDVDVVWQNVEYYGTWDLWRKPDAQT